MLYETVKQYDQAVIDIDKEIGDLRRFRSQLQHERMERKKELNRILHKKYFTRLDIFPLDVLNFINRFNKNGDPFFKPTFNWGYWEQRDESGKLIMVWQGPCSNPFQEYPEPLKRTFVGFQIHKVRDHKSVATTKENYEEEVERYWSNDAEQFTPHKTDMSEVEEILKKVEEGVISEFKKLSAIERRHIREGKGYKVRGWTNLMRTFAPDINKALDGS